MRRESVVVGCCCFFFWGGGGWGRGEGGLFGVVVFVGFCYCCFCFWPTLYLPDYKCYVKLSKMRRESVFCCCCFLLFSPTLSCRIISVL